jgi:exonuclease SbcC
MSYTDAALDLASIHTACLTGFNGAGKSALLDAVTWALWEEARSESDELIAIGESEMWVDLTFTLDGNAYRVRRSRQKTAAKAGTKLQSKGTLELQAVSSEQDKRTSLSGASMRDTQKQINELLRMNYDTFTNSVYLRQGKADEFTKKQPSQRKQVLGEILGLAYFDQLQEAAKAKASELKNQSELTLARLQLAPDLKLRLQAVVDELLEASRQYQIVSEEESVLLQTIKQINEQTADLKTMESQLQRECARLEDLKEEIAVLEKKKLEQADKLKQVETLIESSQEIQEAAWLFDKLKHELEAMDELANHQHKLMSDELAVKAELANKRNRLAVEHELTVQQLEAKKQRQVVLSKAVSNGERLAEVYQDFKNLEQEESKLSLRQQTHNQLNQHLSHLETQIIEARIHLEAEFTQKQKQLNELERLIASKDILEKDGITLKEEAALLDKLEIEFDAIEEKGLNAKTAIESLHNQIKDFKRRQQEYKLKIAELTEHAHVSNCPLCSAPIVDRASVISRYEEEINTLEKQSSETKESIAALEGKLELLRKQWAQLHKQLEGRKDLDRKIGTYNEATSALGKAAEKLAKLQLELSDLSQRLDKQAYAQVERESQIGIKQQLLELDFDPALFANLQAKLRQSRHVEARWHQLKRDIVEFKELSDELPSWENKVQDLQAVLTNGGFAKQEQEGLSAIAQQKDKLGYDAEKHQAIKQQLGELLPVQEQIKLLEKAQAERPHLTEALGSTQNTLNDKTQLLTKLMQETEKLELQLNNLPKHLSEGKQKQFELSVKSQEKQKLSERVAVLKSKEEELQASLTNLGEQEQNLSKLMNEIDDYMLLTEAFGKKGMQAVIIENAVPEIESEANFILGKLSENKMHVALKTQHQTKSGSLQETLELLIADELGTRNYELYSGGEAFKIDFSLRIALSRLLARRAGAKLETLIIDEGFGSQDEVSRRRLIKAIGAIQKDFARILVITHINEVKEMFPVQIHVSKDQGHSQLTIIK